MGISDAARDKARAMVSDLEAQVTSLQNDLAEAQAQLDASKAAGDLLGTVKDTPVVGGLTEGIRGQSTVDAADAQASVDKIQADLSAAETKLAWAKKAEDAVVAVTGDGDDATAAPSEDPKS